MHDLAFIVAGFLVGAVIGLTGVGGGSLMTPILIFVFGVKPYLAVGTDLLFAGFTKLGGTVRLARARLVNWRMVAHLSGGSIPSLPGIWIGSRLMQHTPERAVRSLLSMLLAYAGFKLIAL